MVLPLVKFTEDVFLSFAENEAFCCAVPGQTQPQQAEGDAPSFNKFGFFCSSEFLSPRQQESSWVTLSVIA